VLGDERISFCFASKQRSSDESAEIDLSASCSLGRVSVSLFHDAAEVARIQLDAIQVSTLRSPLELQQRLLVERVRVGRGVIVAAAPLLLGEAANSTEPWLLVELERHRAEKRVKLVALSVQETSVEIEEEDVLSALDFALPIAAASSGPAEVVETFGGALDELQREPPPPLPSTRKRPWYLDEFRLGNMRLLLTYRPARRGARQLLRRLPHVERLPLRLASFERANLCLERARLAEALKKHYKSQVRRQLAKLALHVASSKLVRGRRAARSAGGGGAAPSEGASQAAPRGGVATKLFSGLLSRRRAE
jgi:hypothetical protein